MSIIDISEIGVDFSLRISNFTVKSKTVSKASRVVQKYGGAVPKLPHDPDKLTMKARDIFSGKLDQSLSDKEMRSLAYLSLSLSEDTSFFKEFFKEIRKSSSRRVLSALCASYVMYFNASDSNFVAASKVLKKNKEKLSKNWQRRLQYIDLFSVKTVEITLAKLILDEGSDQIVFDRAGLVGAFAGSRLVENSLTSMAELVEKKVMSGDSESLYKFLGIVCPDGKIKPQAGVAVIIASLRPFLEVSPSAHLKGLLQDIFLKSFSDPRISSDKWPAIPEKFGGVALRQACIGIIKRWLNFEAIELFFKVIAEHAPDEQFEPRKNLWKTYFDQEYVGDAHIVLGQSAARTATRLKRTDESAGGLIWGKLTGANPDQSVLLMQIGDLTVAEWSHNGKFRAWSSEADKKPRFYKSSYSASELRAGSNKIQNVNGSYGDGIVHLGNWVDRAKRYVNQQTGIRLARRIR